MAEEEDSCALPGKRAGEMERPHCGSSTLYAHSSVVAPEMGPAPKRVALWGSHYKPRAAQHKERGRHKKNK